MEEDAYDFSKHRISFDKLWGKHEPNESDKGKETLKEQVEQFLKDAKEILKNDKISEELKETFKGIIEMLEKNSQKAILQIQNAEKETEHALFEFEFK